MNRETFNTIAARLVVELAIAGAFGVIMWQQGAPTWAFTLLVLIATRASKLELHNGLGYLQQTMKRRNVEIEAAIRVDEQNQAAEAMAQALDGMHPVPRSEPGQPPAKIKRHGVGRWGRE